MDWKNVKVPAGGKLMQVRNFTYMHKGATYLIEVDEYVTGNCSAHAEHSVDKNFVIETVSGKTIPECLNLILEKIHTRS
ncbi:MAG: hypothetical protein AB7T49_15030 [Oligoflexales bacterium]